jgi:multidrug efflux system membrane fusion protein
MASPSLRVITAASVLLLGACRQTPNPQAKASSGPPVVPVSAVKAAQESVPTELRIVGAVEASEIVQVRSQVAGPLLRVAFTEGQNVTKGDLLFQIDPRPFQEALRQAEATVNRDRAQINQMQATLARDSAQARFNETDARRFEELAKAGVVSRSQSDQAKTTADVARESAHATEAAIASARAALESDIAAVDAAKLNLSYTEIQSPISGRTGNLLVHAGNLVKANDVPLVVIHQLAPIFVNFAVPERHLASVRRLNANRKLEVRAFPQDSPDHAALGFLSVIDNTVDTTTGTIKLKGTFPNADGALWPGQFVTVVLTLDTIQGATTVPSEAVQTGPQGQYVYVVKQDNTVELRPVTPGRAFGRRFVIESGLAPGETVVTDGHLRLSPGARVQLIDLDKSGDKSGIGKS